jgi:BirA family biotin operon repressor/biotin-[acetyl-CoA-carboxylase] ligase
VHDALADMLPDARGLGCKWPNDILLQRHKVCGILLETAADDGVVVGIGANVAYVPHLDTHLYAATSLYDHGADCSARRLALAVMQHMGVWYDIWSRQGFSPIAQAWTKRAVGIGQAVCVRNTNEPDLTGILQGICPQTGALHVQKPDGTIIKVLAGDVHLV